MYKENLTRIIQHPATVAQNPHILLLTPPPVNEYQLQGFDEYKGNAHPSRTAAFTKEYAEAVREVGASLGVPVVDVWKAFMSAVGWKEGEPLPGSRDLPNLDQFARFFTDGLCYSFRLCPVSDIVVTNLWKRATFDGRWISGTV